MFQQKYQKYKQKYIKLKNQLGGVNDLGELFTKQRKDNMFNILLEDKNKLENILEKNIDAKSSIDNLNEIIKYKDTTIYIKLFPFNYGRHNLGVGLVTHINGSPINNIFVKKVENGEKQFISALLISLLKNCTPNFLEAIEFLKVNDTSYLFTERVDNDITDYLQLNLEKIMDKYSDIKEQVDNFRKMDINNYMEGEKLKVELMQNITKSNNFNQMIKEMELLLASNVKNIIIQIIMSDYYMIEYLGVVQSDRNIDNNFIKNSSQIIEYKVGNKIINHNNQGINIVVGDPEAINPISKVDNDNYKKINIDVNKNINKLLSSDRSITMNEICSNLMHVTKNEYLNIKNYTDIFRIFQYIEQSFNIQAHYQRLVFKLRSDYYYYFKFENQLADELRNFFDRMNKITNDINEFYYTTQSFHIKINYNDLDEKNKRRIRLYKKLIDEIAEKYNLDDETKEGIYPMIYNKKDFNFSKFYLDNEDLINFLKDEEDGDNYIKQLNESASELNKKIKDYVNIKKQEIKLKSLLEFKKYIKNLKPFNEYVIELIHLVQNNNFTIKAIL